MHDCFVQMKNADDDDFIDDSELSENTTTEHEGSEYYPGYCQNTIEFVDGREVLCNEECNPAEQVCKRCRLGYRGTFGA